MNKNMRTIIPIHWDGQEKIPNVFVCGACKNPYACAGNDRCERATDEDYENGQRSLGASGGDE